MTAFTTSPAVALPLAILAAPDVATAKATIKAKPSPTSLLETVRALDGNKEDRYNVALTALTSAYTQALTHGNKTQLTDMLASTGKKVCERAMRNAVQIVGVPKLHKAAATRAEAIETAVMQALDIFAGIACKEPAKRNHKAKAEKPAETVASADTGETVETIEVDVTAMVDSIVALISTGALNADEVDRIEVALIGARMVTAPQVGELALQH